MSNIELAREIAAIRDVIGIMMKEREKLAEALTETEIQMRDIGHIEDPDEAQQASERLSEYRNAVDTVMADINTKLDEMLAVLDEKVTEHEGLVADRRPDVVEVTDEVDAQ